MHHLDVLEPVDRLEQLERRLLDAEHARDVTALVVGDLVMEARAHIGHVQLVDDEIGELEHAWTDALDLVQVLHILEHRGVIVDDGVHARTSERDNRFVLVEIVGIEYVLGDGYRLLGVSRVEKPLSAANLLFGHLDLTTEALEHVDRGDADFGIEHVDHATGEKRNFHAIRTPSRNSLGRYLSHCIRFEEEMRMSHIPQTRLSCASVRRRPLICGIMRKVMCELCWEKPWSS